MNVFDLCIHNCIYQKKILIIYEPNVHDTKSLRNKILSIQNFHEIKFSRFKIFKTKFSRPKIFATQNFRDFLFSRFFPNRENNRPRKFHGIRYS